MNKQFDFGLIRPAYYFFGVSTFLGIVFSFVSTNEQSHFILHLVLWILQTLGPVVILVYCHVWFHKSVYFDRQNPWLKLFFSGLAGAFFFSPLALALDFLWANEELPNQQSQLFLIWFDEFIAIAPPIILSWIAINAPWLLGLRFSKQSFDNSESKVKIKSIDNVQTNLEEFATFDGGFVKLLKHSKASDILYLQSELHYLSVVSSNGKELILYNLKDAIAELPNDSGMQTHRSFWVSYPHVTRLLKQGRQGSVLMSNGDKVPVSRSKFDTLKTKLSTL